MPEVAQKQINKWLITITVMLPTIMEIVDTSVANVALPHMQGSLNAGTDEVTWVLTSYLVSNAIVLPVSGWFATRFGRKRFYMVCVAIFTLSSFLCGIAPSLGALVLFRVLQGIGGGGLAPTEQAILADTFAPSKRGMAFAVYGMAVVLAPAIGPTLGGFITDHYHWRWVFFINVPVGMLSLVLTSRMVTDPPHLKWAKEKAGGIDYIGLSLIAIGLGALEIVLDKGQEDDWFHSSFITWTSAGLMGAAAVVAGQNLGAGHAERANQGVGVAARMGAAGALAIGLAFLLAPATLLGIFGMNEPAALRIGVQLLRVLSVSGVFIAVALAYTGGLQGTGDTRSPLYISLVSQVVVPLGICFVIRRTSTLMPLDIWVAILVGHMTRCALSTLRFKQGSWRAIKVEIGAGAS